jgi:hypothetical protein
LTYSLLLITIAADSFHGRSSTVFPVYPVRKRTSISAEEVFDEVNAVQTCVAPERPNFDRLGSKGVTSEG